MSLPRFALDRPHVILAVTLLAVGLGAFAFWRTPTDLFPEVVPPQVVVVTVQPGASAPDMSDQVTEVLEKEINTVSGLERIVSTSRDEVSSIRAEFVYEKSVGQAVVDVQNAVARVTGSLPEGARQPQIYRVTDATRPLMTLAVSPREDSLKSLSDVRLLADNDLQERLLSVPGVGDVEVFGGHRPEVEVRLDRDALEGLDLDLSDVVARLGGQNITSPAGIIYAADREYLVKVVGEQASPRALADLPLTSSADGRQVRLGDVAEVRLGEADARSAYHGNGRPAIALNVMRPDHGETVSAIRNVKAALEDLRAAHPDLRFEVTEDQQPVIDLNVSGMRASLWQAVALTVLVIFLFLGNLRAAAVVGLSIPLSFLAALTVLWFSPYTLNMVTLSGLIIAVGMVVDASVVVLENIYRHRTDRDRDARSAALEGTREVSLPITAGMLTTVVVLVPVMFTRGFTGRIMTPLNLMIVSTLVASLLVSLTVVPALSARLLAHPPRREGLLSRLVAPLGKVIEWLGDRYVGMVRLALRHRVVALLLLLGFLVFTGKQVRPLLGGEEMPPMDTGVAIVDLDADSSASPEEVEATLTRVEAILSETPGVLTISSVVGSEPGAVSFGGGGATAQSARITVRLVDRTQRDDTIWEIEERWRERLASVEGIRTYRVTEYGATPVSTTKAPLDVIVTGPDPEVLDDLADRILEHLRGTPGLVDLRRSWYRDKVETWVEVSPRLAQMYGTSPAAVANVLRAAVQGVPASRLRLEGYLDIPIRVRYRADQTDEPSSLAEVPVPTRLGRVPLRALGEVRSRTAQPFVTREVLRPSIDVTGGNTGLTIAQVSARATERLEDLDVPAGYDVTVSGTAQDMAEGQAEMRRALVIGLVLLYALLLALFRSFRHPVTIMAAIPLAVAGAMWGLLAFDKPFCKPAFMGLILLGGTIVNNAILMLDFILEARKRGLDQEEAIVRSVRLRIRPILMTAASTIVGFSPLIFEQAVGLERMSPLGIAAAAGLLVGTVVTLVATPLLYAVFESAAERVGGWLRAARTRLGRAAGPAAVLLVAGAGLLGWATTARAETPPPETLTLEQAVEHALEHSPDLEASRADVDRLEGAARSAKAPRWPRLDLDAAGTWSEEPHGLVPGAAGPVQRTDHWLGRTGVSASYLLLDFGGVDARVRAALEEVSAGESLLARREQEVAFEVARLFLSALAVEDLIGAAEATRESLQAVREATADLMEAGRAARVDALKVEVRVARVESRLSELRAERRTLRAALAATVGWEGEAPPTPAWRDTRDADNLDAPRGAPEDRPDVAARRLRQRAAEDRVEAAKRAWYPEVRVQASYDLLFGPDPQPMFPGGDDAAWEDDTVVGLSLTLPLWEGGRRRGDLEQARAAARQARAASRAQRLAARRQVETARADLASAKAQVEANETAVRQGREAVRVEKLRYSAGKGVVNDVLDAEAALLEAEAGLRRARRQVEIAHLSLRLALGTLDVPAPDDR
ncbi:MAG: efflux RND transporter permease subunit [Myxococcota bacterium]